MMLRNRRRQYATLLRVRKHLENLEVEALGVSRRAVARASQERDNIEAQQKHALETAGRIARERLDAGAVDRQLHFERHLGLRAVEKDSEIVALSGKVEEQRAVVVEAATRRRIAEKLLGRATNDHLEHIRHEEVKDHDDAAIMRVAFERRRPQTPL